MKGQAEIPFKEVLAALLDTEQPVNPRYLYHLSDLQRKEIALLEQTWPNIPPARRKSLMEDVQTLGEDDPLLDFEALASLALRDEDAGVRLPAVEALWELEDPMLIQTFADLMENDENEAVRAAAASGLGKYVFLGEIEELPPSSLHQLENRLLAVTRGKDSVEVRRHALEALGFSSRDEVPELIENAYASTDQDWVVSALFAMGRSSDERWQGSVYESLNAESAEVRFEAARAAGELEMDSAREKLRELLDDDDDTVRQASIWSLSQIGGEGVRETLEVLLEGSEDDEEADLIEEALENLDFKEEMDLLPMIELGDDDDDDLDLDGWDDEDEDD